MKVLVLGGTGMLGHKMFQVLRERFPETYCAIRDSKDESWLKKIGVFQPYRAAASARDLASDPDSRVIGGVNAEDFNALQNLLEKMRPGVVVNCVGVIKQREEAKVALPSVAINSYLPHWLANFCAGWGGRLIHFSTDCVFSGAGASDPRGYREDDPSDAEDLYGKSKYLGEVAAENALTLRTSIIGRELRWRRSLLEWFLSQKGRQITGYKRALYSGLTTNHLAEVVAEIIGRHPQLSGLYQVTSHPITKYDLLCLLRDAYQIDVEIIPDEIFHCDRRLNGERFRQATGYTCPPWPELAAQLAKDNTPYENNH
jgi:dTDP-4-dehydrorhamnose reductase